MSTPLVSPLQHQLDKKNGASNGDIPLLSPLDEIPDSLSECRRQVYSFRELDAFNLLPSPVWIFDPRAKAMWWANDKGVEFWGAESLASLLERDFAKGMSKATENRNMAWLSRYQQGENHHIEWTFHPNGGRDGPKNCILELSGIYVTKETVQQKLCQLCIVESMLDAKPKEELEISTKRRMEMLRHFPAVARQFNINGNLMDQNSEALAVFGSPVNASSSADTNTVLPASFHSNAGSTTGKSDESMKDDASITTTSSDKSSTGQQQPILNDFLSQFLDVEEGKRLWDSVKNGHEDQREESREIPQHTLKGTKWFSIKVRSIRDPITSEPVVIYSARDITAIMKAAQERAEREARAKNEFFAVMAHEIRTPLHQVVGFIELLAGTILTEEQSESVNMIQMSAHALIAIINDVLDFTKLEAGEMKLETIPFELRMVVESCRGAIQAQAESKGLPVTVEIDPTIPVKLMGDPNRFRQILSNMLTNAAKFTSAGEISIRARRHADDSSGRVMIRFSVKDTGIGMSQEQQDVIFEPYRQAESSTSRNFGGTGLGLAICRSLVEAMGGRIGVKSKSGIGSTFWFELPFEHFVKPPLQTEDSLKCLKDKESADSLSLRILVAEDNKINQKVVTRMLERLGHEVFLADNGREAVDCIVNTGRDPSEKFDLVLMDWQMPVMDGIDATKEIRFQGFSMSSLPVVGLTASIQSLDWRQIGMNDCLKKPIRLADLKECIAANIPSNDNATTGKRRYSRIDQCDDD